MRRPDKGQWRQRHLLLAAAVTLLVAAISSVTLLSERGQPDLASTTINPGNPEQVALGRRIYSEQCAQCHGVNLEGQPNWRSRGPDGRLPAPPHDASGHTWHHPDQDLLVIVRDGLPAIVPGYESDMPAFGASLTDEEILPVIACLQAEKGKA